MFKGHARKERMAMQTHQSFTNLEKVFGITWRDLADLEPKLGELLWAARQASAACRRWSDVDRAFAPIRTALTELVGFAGTNRRHPVLGGAGAYQVAYLKLYDAVSGLLRCRATSAAEAPENQRAEAVADTRLTEPAAATAARV
jgi:hypothetical protein